MHAHHAPRAIVAGMIGLMIVTGYSVSLPQTAEAAVTTFDAKVGTVNLRILKRSASIRNANATQPNSGARSYLRLNPGLYKAAPTSTEPVLEDSCATATQVAGRIAPVVAKNAVGDARATILTALNELVAEYCK